MMKNILVPVDGSEGSDRAVTEAISIAEACEAKLNFLYVANINQLAINACLSDAILEAVTKAGNVVLDRAMEMVPSGIEKEAFSGQNRQPSSSWTSRRAMTWTSSSWAAAVSASSRACCSAVSASTS